MKPRSVAACKDSTGMGLRQKHLHWPCLLLNIQYRVAADDLLGDVRPRAVLHGQDSVASLAN